MPYVPPAGWVEPVYEDDSGRHTRFHTRPDCPRIKARDQLRQVERPYSAQRCGGCAETYGNNHEAFAH